MALAPAYVYDLLGTPLGYDEADAMQRNLAAARSQGAIPDTILLCEHPRDPDAREVERRERAAARARGLCRAWLGRRGDRSRRPLDLARPRPARRLSDPRPARARQGPAPLRARSRARARARPRPTSGSRRRRARAPSGSASTRRRQDRLDRHPCPGLGRAPRLRAERRLRPRLRSGSSTRAAWTCRSPPSRTSSGGRSPSPMPASRVLRRLGEVLELDVSALPAAAAS